MLFRSEKVNCSSVIIDDEEVPFGSNLLFTLSSGAVLGVEICEDLWVPVPPKMCIRDRRKIFGKTFEKAFGIMLALLLVYSVCSIAFKPATATVAPSAGTPTSSGSSSGSSSSGLSLIHISLR